MALPKELLKSLISTSSLLKYTCKTKPEQKKFDLFKDFTIELLVGCILGHRNHYKHKDHYDLGSCNDRRKKLQKFRQKETFDYFNNKLQIWQQTKPYIKGVCNEGWSFTPSFTKEIDSLLPLLKSNKLLQFSKWATQVPVIYDKESHVTPNLQSMITFFNNNNQTTHNRLIMWAYQKSFHLHNGVIPQYYKKGINNGLYYPTGGLALTNMSRDIRNTIMDGYYQYDIQSAVFSILLELSNCTSKSTTYPTLTDYCLNTKTIRNQVATRTTMDYESVKACFLTIGFGGSLTGWGSIANTVPTCYLKMFSSDVFVINFLKELKLLTKELAKQYPKDVLWAKAQRKNNRRQYKNKFCCLLYQRELNSVLEAIAKLSQTPNDALYVYDAIYIKDDLKISDVIAQVYQETGLNLLFTKI